MFSSSQSKLPNSDLLFQKIKKTIEKNKESELFYKAFLRPIQITLKTHATQNDRKKLGCLPYGIKQVFKTSIDDNKYTLIDFQSLDTAMYGTSFKDKRQYDIQAIKSRNCDNLISLLKPAVGSSSGLKVAICICMYSEDKTMLKRTLAGVSQNIAIFNQNGISFNQIGVFVIMDGIQVVNKSVQQFFEELQKENNIYLSDDVQNADIDQLISQTKDVQDQQIENINHLIFKSDQFQDRKKRRFSQRKRQYKMHKQMIKQVQILEKEKVLTYDQLDSITQKFFIEKVRQQWKKQHAGTDDEAKNMKLEILLDLYAQNIKVSLPFIRQALNQTKKYCKQYISSRDDLALLNSFRVSINLTDPKDILKKQNGNIGLNQQEQIQKQPAKMNLFMVTKYKNRGKLSSHNWFFNGFCQQLKPQFAILLDVGLSPDKKSLWQMCKHMMVNQRVGGVCGYMGLRIERLQDGEEVKDETIDCITSLCMKFVDIQRAQQFQYHFAHLVDKPFEACFDFIHVLPGAFSAYRMQAIRPGGESDPKILKQYFKSIDQQASSMSYKAYKYTPLQTICKVALPQFIYQPLYGKPQEDSYQRLLYDENVYLAEDRTLCMGIYQNKYIVTYLPDATAWVDPIKTLYGMLGQRKRWINGSFFAFEKVKQSLQKVRGHCLLSLQILYLTFMNALSFISPALFMYTIHIAMYTFQTNVIVTVLQQLGVVSDTQEANQNQVVGVFVYTIDFIYVMIFLGLIFYSMHLTNREARFKTFFYGVSTVYGLFSLAVFGVMLFDIISGFASGKNEFLINNPWFIQAIAGGQKLIDALRYIMLGIIGLYIIPIIIFMIFCRLDYIIDILFSTFSFVFYTPTYLNILNIYALCRIDDISWGTKGLDSGISGQKKEMMEDWKKIKILHVSKFVLYNMVVAFLLLLFGDIYVVRFYITLVIMCLLGGSLSIKVFMGAIYLIKYRCYSSKKQPVHIQTTRPVPDVIEQNFAKVKKSMYKGIQEAIKGIQKEAKQTSNLATLPALIFSSKIYQKMNLGKSKKSQQLKHSRNLKSMQQNFSKIQKINTSKALYNMNKYNKKYEKDTDIIFEQREKETQMENSEGSLRSQKNLIQIKQQNKVPIKPTVTRKRKQGTSFMGA